LALLLPRGETDDVGFWARHHDVAADRPRLVLAARSTVITVRAAARHNPPSKRRWNRK
jgi:hypothetical protein